MSITPEREEYHACLPLFAKRVPQGAVVLDVGKHKIHDYSTYFPGREFRTIDSDEKVRPHILADLEEVGAPYLDVAPIGDAAQLNGVADLCNNPFHVVRGLNRLLRDGSPVLFGIMGPAYPWHNSQRYLFTNAGAKALLRQNGFKPIETVGVSRDGFNSYNYIIAEKVSSV